LRAKGLMMRGHRLLQSQRTTSGNCV
jgi:hypothetical protein